MQLCEKCNLLPGIISKGRYISKVDGSIRLRLRCRLCVAAEARRYRASPKGKIAQRLLKRRQYLKHHLKHLSRQKFRRALKAGHILRPTFCSSCFIPCIPEGHHQDYSKPFEVVWLCRPCHNMV